MPMSVLSRCLIGALLLSAAAFGGCNHAATRVFDDRPRQDVWDAMVQASKEPRYPDWIVVQNQVLAQDENYSVHVYRELKRDLVTPGLDPHREEEAWRFTAALLPGNPVTVEFTSPDWAVPAHFWAQADHYFAQVRLRLAEMGPITPAPGDPMGARTPRSAQDPKAPGDLPPAPAPGELAKP
ncbi:MAG: hypothetical protein JNK53_02145 [Phycisphaerae bacterium]|nr:hypothetical protein [Phycisphaerae bacterium]